MTMPLYWSLRGLVLAALGQDCGCACVGAQGHRKLVQASGVPQKEVALGGGCPMVPRAAVAMVLGPGCWLVSCSGLGAPLLCAQSSQCCVSFPSPPPLLLLKPYLPSAETF